MAQAAANKLSVSLAEEAQTLKNTIAGKGPMYKMICWTLVGFRTLSFLVIDSSPNLSLPLHSKRVGIQRHCEPSPGRIEGQIDSRGTESAMKMTGMWTTSSFQRFRKIFGNRYVCSGTVQRATNLAQMSELVPSANHPRRVTDNSRFEWPSDNPSGPQNSLDWRDSGIIPIITTS